MKEFGSSYIYGLLMLWTANPSLGPFIPEMLTPTVLSEGQQVIYGTPSALTHLVSQAANPSAASILQASMDVLLRFPKQPAMGECPSILPVPLGCPPTDPAFSCSSALSGASYQQILCLCFVLLLLLYLGIAPLLQMAWPSLIVNLPIKRFLTKDQQRTLAAMKGSALKTKTI